MREGPGVVFIPHGRVARELGEVGCFHAGHRAAFLIHRDDQRGLTAAGGKILAVPAEALQLIRFGDVLAKQDQAADIEAADQLPQILVEFTPFEADHETLAGQLFI